MNKNAKPTVLCTWEIGSELGHLSRIAAITQALEPDFYTAAIIKDLSRASPFFQHSSTQVFQAPVWLPKIKMQRPVACLADTLLLLGYLDAEPLHSLMKGWRSLIDLIKPDLILFDYSPTAMLATLSLDIPKVMVGTGFGDPAAGHPIIDWRPHYQGINIANDGLVQRQENRVLNTINQVLEWENQPPLERMSDLFRTDHALLNTFPDLDLYRDLRQNADYCLKHALALNKPTPTLPKDRTNIAAYLKPQYPQLKQLVEALAKCNAHCTIISPTGDPAFFKTYESETFQTKTELVNLMSTIEQADLFLGHGNMSSTCESLQLGKPSMIFPIQLEQLLNGQRINQMGVGRLIPKIESAESLTQQINEMLTTDSYKKKAQRFAEDNRKYWQTSMPEKVAQLCRSELL